MKGKKKLSKPSNQSQFLFLREMAFLFPVVEVQWTQRQLPQLQIPEFLMVVHQ